ncbi:Uncharacterised protein [uncultured archaeon]|nr:Uncharacterised protein [uncultured archaeon]
MKNKRGEKLMVFWWFLASMFVFVVVFLTAINFFAKPVDVRGLQTEIVYSNLYDCLVSNSYLRPEVLEEGFNLSEFCHMRDQKSIQDLRFLIYLDIVDKDAQKSLLVEPIKLGDGSLYSDCEISSQVTNPYSPSCLNRTNVIPVYYLEEGDVRKVAFFNVLIASQYSGSRINVGNISGIWEGKNE